MAEVFAWDEGRALKLFRRDWGMSEAEQEARAARLVYDAGIPSPAIYETVTVDGRAGIVFERVAGSDMADGINPGNGFGRARLLAELHATMHARAVPTFPPQKPRLRWQIERAPGLDQRIRDAAQRALDALPDGDAVCHGDFHPKNVLLTATSAVVIDWNCVTRGNPLGDVARTVLLLRNAHAATREPKRREAVRRFVARLLDAYLTRYFELTARSRAELEMWRLPMTAARLNEGVEHERRSHILALRRLLRETKA